LEATLTSPLGCTTLDASTLRIGQASDNQLVIDDLEVAAHHAEIQPSSDGTAHLIIDQSSTHGTFVNKERLSTDTPRLLKAGDVIRIGNLDFTYSVNSLASTSSPSDQPSAPDQASMLQQRKRRVGFWIAVAVVVLLVIAGGTWGTFYYTNRSTPTKTLQAFCTAFQNGDAQGLYDILSKRTQAQASVDKLKAVFSFLAGAGGIQSCTVSNVQESGSMATGDVTMNLKGSKSGQPYPEHLVNEGGTWKVDESPSQG
jgi:pSer/pThr/pTyr-binding forkhead associated (FHA) protein